ncbi:MAG TPA: hypothetical protein VLI05_00470 [Candidatus Saccharimonadia bacterium]|nr:hypothetical protein [Candidatus Saccharimonadia bacterium]
MNGNRTIEQIMAEPAELRRRQNLWIARLVSWVVALGLVTGAVIGFLKLIGLAASYWPALCMIVPAGVGLWLLVTDSDIGRRMLGPTHGRRRQWSDYCKTQLQGSTWAFLVCLASVGLAVTFHEPAGWRGLGLLGVAPLAVVIYGLLRYDRHNGLPR